VVQIFLKFIAIAIYRENIFSGNQNDRKNFGEPLWEKPFWKMSAPNGRQNRAFVRTAHAETVRRTISNSCEIAPTNRKKPIPRHARSASESLWKIRPELSFATTHFSPGLRSSLMMWLSPCNEHWSQTSSKIFFHMVTFRSFLSDRERGGLFRERTSSTLFDTARDIFPRNLTKRYLRNLKPIEPEPTRAVTTKITTNKRFHNFRRRCCPLNRNFYSSPPPLFVPSHRVHYSITVARGLKAGDDK